MEAFAPCLGVNNAVFIAITTALGDDNYITRLFARQDAVTREKFTTLHVSLHCEDCQKKGRTPYQCMADKHMESKQPAWKASRNIEQVNKLLGSDELFGSEQAGVIRARKSVFEAAWLMALKQAPLLSTNEILTQGTTAGFGIVYTYIDLSGGGKQSDLALVSIAVLADGKIVVVGLSRGRNRDHLEEEKTVRGHFSALRSLPTTRNALYVHFTESNYGGASSVTRVESYIENYGPQVPYREVLKHPGVRTTPDSREQAMALAIHALRTGNVCFAQQVACAEKDEYGNVRELFFNQLGRIQKKIKPGRTDINRYEYSGKAHDTPDDLGMGFCDLLRWVAEYQRLEHFRRVQSVIDMAGAI